MGITYSAFSRVEDQTGATLSPTAREAARKEIALHTECYLKNGGKIEQVPPEATGFPDPKATLYSTVNQYEMPPNLSWSQKRKMFMVTVYGFVLGYYKTMPDAEKARDEHINPQAKKNKSTYACYEEVLSRGQKYAHTGTLKQMITGTTARPEKKFTSGWKESNHMNCVLLKKGGKK